MNNIIFGLYDVLIKGKLNKDIDFSYLDDLSKYLISKKVNLYLVTGLLEDKCNEIIDLFSLDKFFKKENIIFINQEYLDSLSEIDKKIRFNKFKEDLFYHDDYHKVYFINNHKNLNSGNTLFVGHDLWTDAFYISRYTKANVILLKETLSYNNFFYKKDFKTIYTISSDFISFKNFLESGKLFDYSALNNFAHKKIYGQMVGQINFGNIDFGKVVEKYYKSKKDINSKDINLFKDSKNLDK
ncbi:MAG: hypothetical protein PHR26_01160 [Candidatus ainarchaeum sp.]|nr:hypothetical protein [Candidatus ainarchaeum sp.]MDD3976011.1 hypothetical protein [Candidatus ainarchaeum sp.]